MIKYLDPNQRSSTPQIEILNEDTGQWEKAKGQHYIVANMNLEKLDFIKHYFPKKNNKKKKKKRK